MNLMFIKDKGFVTEMFCMKNYEVIIMIFLLFLNILDQCSIEIEYTLKLLKPMHIMLWNDIVILVSEKNMLLSIFLSFINNLIY